MDQMIDLQKEPLTRDDYNTIESMESCHQFVRQKNRFLFTITGIFLFIYILLPILAFQPILQTPVIGAITGVWIYSALLFLMTIILCTLYIRKATHFDKLSARLIAEYQATRGGH